MRAQQGNPTASMWRRLAAFAYDVMLLFSVLFCATWILVLVHGGRGFAADDPLHPLYVGILLLLIAAYFLWPWTHGGQTLGMRSWRLRLVDLEGQPVGWPRALLRLFLAPLSWLPLGLGFIWILCDRQGLAWHDRLSGSQVIPAP